MGFSKEHATHRGASPQGFLRLLELASASDSDGSERKGPSPDRATAGREDLPYRVELWDAKSQIVEQVLAVTSNSSIGYAAYYAATREYPDRLVTLRHKNRTVVRSSGPEQ